VSRYLDVDVTVSDRSVGAVASDVTKALRQISFPLQHRAELVRDYTTSQRERRGFLAVCIAAAVGMFLLLQNTFRSWRLAAVMFLALPSALAGGVVGARAAGSFSIGSMVGFFALFAIATRSMLLLIGRYRELELHESTTERLDLVIEGTRTALVPLVGAAVGTAFALSPLVFFGNRAGYEIVHRLAVVVVCGLVTVTLFALVVVPALYLRFARRAVPDVFDELSQERELMPAAATVASAGAPANGPSASWPTPNGPLAATASTSALSAVSPSTNGPLSMPPRASESDIDASTPTRRDER
jgi:Cu/Ag efflux pump CusA